MGFVIACRVAHLYTTVAVFDPKVGERGLDRYVVVTSHGQHRVGDILNIKREHPPKRSTIKVAICGFPNTGKTCLHYGLKTALLQIPDVPDAYVISGCPDGEGSFFSQTARHNPEFARQLKDEYKRKFTPEFAKTKARDISVIPNSLLVFDVGGKISPENRTIMSQATHAVILGKSDAEIETWRAFCQELNLPVVAILYSDYQGTADCLDGESAILKGSVHHLDRTEDASSRLMVRKLARVLADLTIGQEVRRCRTEIDVASVPAASDGMENKSKGFSVRALGRLNFIRCVPQRYTRSTRGWHYCPAQLALAGVELGIPQKKQPPNNPGQRINDQ